MKTNVMRKFLVGILSVSGLSALMGCGSQFVDYAHNGSCVLALDYVGHDFFKDGVGEVELKSPIDGDTAHFYSKVGDTSTVLKARFYGIDTPESTGAIQPWGKAASNFTKEKLKNAAENGTIVISSPAQDYAEPQTDSTGSRYLSLVWINETKKNAPFNELYLLNLWIVQEGLSWAKNVSAVPKYADIFQEAQNQAEKHKLYLWSGKDDPDYNYGEYNETSLLDIKYEIAEFIEDHDHVNAFSGANVYFTGTVSGYADNSLYVQEFYPTDPEHPENGGEYAGINIFTGMTAIASKYTEVGAYLRVAGKAVDSENFGFQITDTRWPLSDTEDITDSKVLYPASENTGIHKLKVFEYTAQELNEIANNNGLENLYCRTHVTDDLICNRVYINASGETTLYFKDTKFAVYMPFKYAGDPDDSSAVWNNEDDFLGKVFNITGVYSYHKTESGKINYQLIPSGSGDLVCKTPAHGTVQYNPFSVSEAEEMVHTGNYSETITYHVKGIIDEISDSKIIVKEDDKTFAINNYNTDSLNAKAKANLIKGSTVFAKGHFSSSGMANSVLLAVYPHGGIESDPLSLDEALEKISETASDTIFVFGEITSIESEYNPDAKNPRMSFSLGELKFVNGKLASDVDYQDIVVGASVIIKGKLQIVDGVKTFNGLPQVVSVYN